ncbi:MAG: ribosome maturation factor RimM [Gammaproteobacteria bacterium]|nr:ribosome maturation factor RimM [Gammaproteobacteria bacterium]
MVYGTGSDRVTLGRLGKTHGLQGWLRLDSFTDPVLNITEYRRFFASRGPQQELVMDQVQEQGSKLLAHFEGFDDPEAAQQLVGAELQIAASELPDLSDDQYYWHQLIGLTVTNREGQLLGQVDRMLETGANDVLVVKATAASIDEHERLIPYLRDTVVRRVNLDQGNIEVEWGADYLLE